MQNAKGTLRGIARRAKSRAAMEELSQAEVTLQGGVEGDSRGQPGSRQVTVLSADDWDLACEEHGKALPWTTRRANLLVQGLQLADSQEAILRIGQVQLQVTGETDPCSRMDEASSGLRATLQPDWRGGVCCRVLAGGEVRMGDTVELIAKPDAM